MHSLVEARQRFYSFRQTSRISTAEFLRIYQGLVDTIIRLDGNFCTDEAVIRKLILADNQDPNNTTTWDAMKTIVREEYLAINLFLIADHKRYGGLLAITQNNYVSNVDKYPKTLSKSYDMLVNYLCQRCQDFQLQCPRFWHVLLPGRQTTWERRPRQWSW